MTGRKTPLDSLRGRYRRNILIVGSEDATETVLREVRSSLEGPIKTCVLPGPLSLPDLRCGALILRNVSALSSSQQSDLMEWLESGPCMPVVSVSSSPLFPLVGAGGFSDRLYYRLNMILEDADTALSPATGEFRPNLFA
jgi:hypothetical protein